MIRSTAQKTTVAGQKRVAHRKQETFSAFIMARHFVKSGNISSGQHRKLWHRTSHSLKESQHPNWTNPLHSDSYINTASFLKWCTHLVNASCTNLDRKVSVCVHATSSHCFSSHGGYPSYTIVPHLIQFTQLKDQQTHNCSFKPIVETNTQKQLL